MSYWLRTNILVALLLTTIVAFAAPDSPSARSADASMFTMPDTLSRTYRHTEAVKRLHIERDTLAARHIWQGIVAEDSLYSPALYNLSRVERGERALRYAERAYKQDSNNRWYAQNYAKHLVVARRYSDALPVYRTLVRLDPRDIEAYHALAVLYASGGMPYSAISILDSAEIRTGYNIYLAAMKQQLLIETRQFDKAIDAGERIVEEYPYDIDARTTLAYAYEAAGRDSVAQLRYEEAFRMDSTNLQTLTALVDYYERKGDTQHMFDYEKRLFRDRRVTIDDKLRRLEQYTSDLSFYSNNYFNIGAVILGLAIDYPNNRKVTDAYASHLLAAGEYETALELLRRHLNDEGTTDAEFISLLQLENYLERTDLIAMDLSEGLARFPKSLALHTFAAYLANEHDEYRLAVELIEEAIGLCKSNEELSETWGYLGDIHHSAANDRAAFKAYRRALSYNGDNAMVLNNYAYFLSLLDRELDKALEMTMKAVMLEPNNATYIDTYAWVLHRLGRNDEAKEVMRQALSLSGQKDSSLLAHYGDILWALGEEFMADTYWKKAVDMGYDAEEMRLHQESLKENRKR